MIIVGTLRKLIWAFEFRNKMLVSNIRCKNLSKKASSFRKFYSNFLRREGWEINGLSPLSWQLFEILWPLGCFQSLKSSETDFYFKKTQISQFDTMKCSFFWTLSFAKDVLLQRFNCVFVLAIRGLLHMTKNLSCGVTFVF